VVANLELLAVLLEAEAYFCSATTRQGACSCASRRTIAFDVIAEKETFAGRDL
jgi:hypothetical protein